MVRSAPREWTVLVYNAGSSNAGMSCTHNLLDMERVGSDDFVQVVCMNARDAWVPEAAGLWREYTGARTYALGAGTGEAAPRTELGKAWSFLKTSPAAVRSPEIAQGEPDMSDPETLRKFLLENVERYPSKRVAVIIGGHGAGFAGQVSTDGKRMSNEALAGVLGDVQKKLGKKIDLVDFNNCYGASLEVMHPLRDVAECAVGSQSVQWGPTQPLGEVLGRLQAELKGGKDVTGADLGRIFVDAAASQPLANLSTRTLSAVDPSGLGVVADRLAVLHQTLMDEKVPPAQIREWMALAEKDEYASIPRSVYNYDLVSFARVVAENAGSEAVREAASAVGAAVNESVVSEQHAQPGRDGLVGWGLKKMFSTDMPSSPGGLSVHYDADVNARGNRLAAVKDTELGRQLGIEPFLRYVSQSSDEERVGRSWLGRQLEEFGYDSRVAQHRHPWLRPLAVGAGLAGLAGLALLL